MGRLPRWPSGSRRPGWAQRDGGGGRQRGDGAGPTAAAATRSPEEGRQGQAEREQRGDGVIRVLLHLFAAQNAILRIGIDGFIQIVALAKIESRFSIAGGGLKPLQLSVR